MIIPSNAWEKISPRLYKHENLVIVQWFSALNSTILTVIGGLLIASGAFALRGDVGANEIPYIIFMAFGCFFVYKGIVANKTRKEGSGVHPNDTLYIFDPGTKTVTEQQGTKEEKLSTFEEMRLEVEMKHDAKLPTIHVVLSTPKGKRPLFIANTKEEAEKFIADIKKHIS